MSTNISKEEINLRIFLDIGSIVSAGLAAVFTVLVFKVHSDYYFWGTGVFIAVSLLCSLRRLKPTKAETRPQKTEPLMFQNADTLAALEDRKAMESLENVIFRFVVSVAFLVFMPIDLIIQIINLIAINSSKNALV